VEQRHLSEEQHKNLGQLLSSAIIKKESPHPDDLQRASVLIYSLIKNNYPFDDTDIDLAIETSGEKYSDFIKKLLMEMIDVYVYLARGLENPANERFMLKEGL
jgi:hypothetical protein